MRSPIERRIDLLHILSKRRFETIENLSTEFSVSKMTIRRDIDYLCLSYPIYTLQGRSGGIYVNKNWYFNKLFLSKDNVEFIEGLMNRLNDEEKKRLHSIIKTFSAPKRGKERSE